MPPAAALAAPANMFGGPAPATAQPPQVAAGVGAAAANAAAPAPAGTPVPAGAPAAAAPGDAVGTFDKEGFLSQLRNRQTPGGVGPGPAPKQ